MILVYGDIANEDWDEEAELYIVNDSEAIPDEEWVVDHGVVNYPNAIYFFADISTEAY